MLASPPVRSRPNSAHIRQSNGQFSRKQNPGFFQGAYKTDASRSIFIDVAGGLNIQNSAADTEAHENAILDKLPHAIGAGHSSGSHKPCLEGTRTQVLAEIEVWEVDDKDESVYWLKGVAGCGKSTIAQSVAERSAASGRLVVSFFCSRDFEDRRNLHLIIPTIAYYLAYQHPPFKAAVVPSIRSNPHIQHDSLAVQFDKLLIGPLKLTGLRATIIIDALDECEDKEPVSEFLSALAQHVHEVPFVKIFITGRPEDHIRSGFAIPSLRTRELPLHDVDSATVDSDIESYVRTQLREIAKRRRLGIRGPWPSENDIMAIIRKCSGFFIIASVIIDFIDDRYETPQDRLNLIVSLPNSTIYEGMSRMDVAYHQILEASFRGVNKDNSRPFALFRLVVASIVLAFNPLSRASLARILGVSSERIWMILSQLHSVLIVPESDTKPIRICHKSFADFLTDAQRCRDARFHMDAHAYHLGFGVRCFDLMNTTLKRNLCHLPRYAMNDDVKDLPELREKYVGPALAYACESWINHLRSSAAGDSNMDTVVGLVNAFFEKQFLAWLEVLSIEGNLRVAVYSMRSVKSWLTDRMTPPSNLLILINDCEQFVLRFFSVIEMSAAHIYHSALPWSPMSSLVRNLYQMQMTSEAKLMNAVDADWDACIRTILLRRPVAIALSRKGASLAVVSPKDVTIFDTLTGVIIFKVQQDMTQSVDFSPDDTMLVCGLWDKSVKVWDVQKSALVQKFVGHTGIIRSAAFSSCGNMMASGGSDKTVRIWDVSSGCCRCVLKGHSSEVSAICWSGTGDKLRVVSASWDTTVRVWDSSKQTCSMILREHTARVTSLTSLPESCSVASGSLDRTVKVYDSHSGNVLRTIPTDQIVLSVQLSNDGDKIMYSDRGSATIWDLTRSTRVSTINCDGDHVALSPDSAFVASRGDGFVKIWSTETCYLNSATTKDLFQGASTRFFFSPDGQVMASTSDSKVKFWDMTSGECLFTFNSAYALLITFSSDAAFVACLSRSYGGTQVQVFNVRTRKAVSIKHLDIKEYSLHVALSPGGNRLVSLTDSDITLWDLRSSKCLARLWDFASGKRLAHLYHSSSSRSQIAFSVDGTRVSVKNNDGNIRCWRIFQAQLPSHVPSSDSDLSTSLPLVFLPIHKGLSHHDVFGPRRRCRYTHLDEWIVDGHWRRILWVPPDRRSVSSDFHGKTIVMRTEAGRIYVANFSDVLSS